MVKSGCRMETVACEPQQPQRGDFESLERLSCVGEEAWLGLLGLFSCFLCSFLHKILNRGFNFDGSDAAGVDYALNVSYIYIHMLLMVCM